MKLKDQRKEIDDAVSAKKSEVQEAWTKFDSRREELAKSDTSVAELPKEEFDKFDALNRDYDDKADELTELERRRQLVWAKSSHKADDDIKPRSTQDEMLDRIKDGFGSSESHGARIAGGELYKAAQKSGVFNRSEKSRLGEVALGQMMDRGEFHALITGGSDTSAGALVEPMRRGYVQAPDRPLLLLDLITVGTTDSDMIEYVRETSFTNAAAPVAEATDVSGSSGVKPQSTLAYEKVQEAVKTIAHWIATTRRAVADAGQLATMIDGRLRMGLLQVLENQLASGSGSGENLKGIYNQPILSHEPEVGDSLLDSVHKALTRVRLAYYLPSAVGIHSLDWQDIRLAKNDNGDYLYGPPALAGAQTIWGLPKTDGPQFVEGSPIVGDFSQVEFYIREGVQVLASDSHADFFIRNLLALLAEMRGGLAVPLPEALCAVESA